VITSVWIEEILNRTDQLLDSKMGQIEICGASQDTRQLRSGQLFVALDGDNTDGNRFVKEALKAGAPAALLSHRETFEQLSEAVPEAVLWLVRDPLLSLQELAAAHMAQVAPRVVAITGSNGKTSTKDICGNLLGTFAATFASEGNYNNQIGLPMSILSMPGETEIAVLEMGCSSFGEIARLCQLFPPEVGIVINIGSAHLDILGDLAGVARAKGELPRALPPEGLLVLPQAEKFREQLAGSSRAPIRTFGVGGGADLQVTDLGLSGEATRRYRIGEQEGSVPRPTRHTLLSLAAAWLVALHLGGDPSKFPGAVSGESLEGNRATVYRLGPWTIMDDSYNANPDSVGAALEWLVDNPGGGERWAVIGDMLELGVDAGEIHGVMGQMAAALGVDQLLTCGSLCRQMVSGAREAGLDTARHFPDRETLAAHMLQGLGVGDLILVKGSRGMAMEKVIGILEELSGFKREAIN
jgi:UDP-N-acetylmuramoyl-tripeptide--D-alanyl-D-alanine ligase